MKKLLIIAAALLAAASAYAQGSVTFVNNTATKIIYGSTGQGIPANLAGTFAGTDIKVGLYAGTSSGNLQLIKTVNVLSSGVFSAGTAYMTVDGTSGGTVVVAGGGTAFLQVKAWQGTFNSFDAAVSGGGYAGASTVWSQVTGNLNASDPAKPITGNPGLSQITLVSVPEPATFALFGLGGAALLMIRRRK